MPRDYRAIKTITVRGMKSVLNNFQDSDKLLISGSDYGNAELWVTRDGKVIATIMDDENPYTPEQNRGGVALYSQW